MAWKVVVKSLSGGGIFSREKRRKKIQLSTSFERAERGRSGKGARAVMYRGARACIIPPRGACIPPQICYREENPDLHASDEQQPGAHAGWRWWLLTK